MASLEDHYDALRGRERDDPVDDLSRGDRSPAETRRRFVAGEDARAFADELAGYAREWQRTDAIR